MTEIDLFTAITNQGFAIAVTIFLLYERQKYNNQQQEFNNSIVQQLQKIAIIIDERIPKEG